MAIELTARQRRWVDALLVLGTIALALLVLGQVVGLFFYFGDVILVFFLAWLVAFILSPTVDAIVRRVPRLGRALVTAIVYVIILGIFFTIVIVTAGALVSGIRDFIANQDTFRANLPQTLAPWQQRLDAIGLGQVNIVDQANALLNGLSTYANQLVGPLQQIAVASIGVAGNLLIVVLLSVYVVIDRDKISSFLFRIVPPGRQEEARLLEDAVSRSFGGFLRGQAVMGLTYAGVALIASAAGDLPLVAVTTAAAGILQAIPFFGPFVSWAPPVLVAILTNPDAVLPVLAIMAIGWFVIMNIIQPRLMQDTVGIHPIVVLGSVLIGARAAGIAGAIFGIPISAVVSAFFFHYLRRSAESGSVASRAARRLEERVGRPVRVPREPSPGIDPDVETETPTDATSGRRPPDPPGMAHPDRQPRPGDA
jgi:predicted PurR-regulated permease PerM